MIYDGWIERQMQFATRLVERKKLKTPREETITKKREAWSKSLQNRGYNLPTSITPYSPWIWTMRNCFSSCKNTRHTRSRMLLKLKTHTVNCSSSLSLWKPFKNVKSLSLFRRRMFSIWGGFFGFATNTYPCSSAITPIRHELETECKKASRVSEP
jgi:hypothetical protein